MHDDPRKAQAAPAIAEGRENAWLRVSGTEVSIDETALRAWAARLHMNLDRALEDLDELNIGRVRGWLNVLREDAPQLADPLGYVVWCEWPGPVAWSESP